MLLILSCIVISLISLWLVIGVHEAGHALAAYLCRVNIKKITLGFGTPLFRWERASGCQWILALWPLGGSVLLLNTRIAPVSPDDLLHALDKKPIITRCVIYLSGALANLLMAWFALSLMVMLNHPQTIPMIATVTQSSIAASAGLSTGDKISRIADSDTPSWDAVSMQLMIALGKNRVPIVFEKASGIKQQAWLDLSSWHAPGAHQTLLMSLGITPNLSPQYTQDLAGIPCLQAVVQGILTLLHLIYFYVIMLKNILTGLIPFTLLLGPIGLFKSIALSFFQGVAVFLYFIANLSIVMAWVNLLPIPGFDGGSIVYAILEKIRRKPLSIAMELLLHRLVLIAMGILLLQLVTQDLLRLVS